MQKKFANLCRLILADKNTRNLFFFLILNLFFAFIELSYGLWTNSLGLISDSFHMFFDCSALLLGLAASLVTKWKPSDKFTYGFGRAEILAGLANGLFLLFIALFIMKEAIERTFEPPEVHHERLFVISVLGFIVNLVGIFVFQHGGQGHHHHGSSGCDHSHSHSTKHLNHHHHHHNHDQHHDDHHNHSLHNHNYHHHDEHQPLTHDNNNHDYNPSAMYQDNHLAIQFEDNNHSHGQASRGRGQIMQSVFLHIVADTLGSIGVMVSAVLMSQFGWMIADPVCSIFIAILISVSVYPLLRESFYVLMQRIPVEIDDKLPKCLSNIRNLSGVISIHDVHVWTLNSDIYVGCLKLEVSREADQRFIQYHSKAQLTQIGINRLHIQIDQV